MNLGLRGNITPSSRLRGDPGARRIHHAGLLRRDTDADVFVR